MFPLIHRKGPPRKRQRPRLQPRLEGLEGLTLLSAGLLDQTFGTEGKVATNFIDSNYDRVYAMVVQPDDGKIVVAGYSNPNPNQGIPGSDFVLARYNPDGSLDATFGTGGKVTTDFTSSTDDVAFSVALQDDGKIVVAGYSHNPRYSSTGYTGYDFALARYDPDGKLDTTFGTGGKVTTDFASSTDFAASLDIAYSVALQDDGKIVVAGYSNPNRSSIPGSDFVLARYNPNGSLDVTFGTGGKVTTDLASSTGYTYDYAFSVAVQADDGKIVVAGYSGIGTRHDFALARYNPDGKLDATFGTGGKVTTDFASGIDVARSVALQADGKIVVAGYSNQGSTGDDFALARYDPDGKLDTSFGPVGSGGKVTTDFASGTDVAHSVALQADGKIVVAGYSNQGSGTNDDFALARYEDKGAQYQPPAAASYSTPDRHGHGDRPPVDSLRNYPKTPSGPS